MPQRTVGLRSATDVCSANQIKKLKSQRDLKKKDMDGGGQEGGAIAAVSTDVAGLEATGTAAGQDHIGNNIFSNYLSAVYLYY